MSKAAHVYRCKVTPILEEGTLITSLATLTAVTLIHSTSYKATLILAQDTLIVYLAMFTVVKVHTYDTKNDLMSKLSR